MNKPDSRFDLFLKSLKSLYWNAGKKASSDLKTAWMIIPFSLALYAIFLAARTIFAPLGIAGMFLNGFMEIAFLSIYYLWIIEARNGRHHTFKDFLQFDWGMFSAVLSIAFLLFIAELILMTALQGTNLHWIFLCFHLILVITLNAIPEVLIIRRMESLPALSEAWNFIRENWIEWFIPFLILLAPVLYINRLQALFILTLSEPLLPSLVIIEGWGVLGTTYGAVLSVVGILLANWFVIFRCYLYEELDGGSRRSRLFQQNS